MKKILKMILGVLASAFLFILVLFLFFIYKLNELEDKFEQVDAIKIPAIQSQIYVYRKNWGLMGQSQLVLFTSQEKSEIRYNMNTDYHYSELQAILYKVSNDTLTIYAMLLSPIPNNFSSKIIVNQIELHNWEYSALLDSQKYVKMGLKLID